MVVHRRHSPWIEAWPNSGLLSEDEQCTPDEQATIFSQPLLDSLPL